MLMWILTNSLSWMALAAGPAPRVQTFSPTGEVKSPQQIRIQFSEAMVRMGNPRAEAPVTGECLKEGSGRWVDGSNWVYDFDKALASGVSCHLSLKPNLTSLRSAKIAGTKEFSFNTGGPSVVGYLPQEYDRIDENQSFVFFFDGEPGDLKNAPVYFMVEGLGDKISAQFIEGSEKIKLLRAAFDSNRWQDFLKVKKGKLQTDYAAVVVKASRPFPPGAKITVIWDKGLSAKSGLKTSSAKQVEFTVRESFNAKFSCEREKPDSPCIPLLQMTLNFSYAVPASQMAGMYLLDSAGQKILPSNSTDKRESFTSLYFKGPFTPNADYQVVLPGNLKDDSGRPLDNASKFPLKIRTAEAPPLLKFAAPFGIIEAGPEAALPVTLRQIEKQISTRIVQDIYPIKGTGEKLGAGSFKAIIQRLASMENASYGTKALLTGGTSLQITKPLAEKEFEVVGLPLKGKGLFTYEMVSPRLGESLTLEKHNFYVRSTALVTELAVHLKFSSREALVWVTKLKNSEIVKGAKISLYTCEGKNVGEALSDDQGIAKISWKGKNPESVRCEDMGTYGYGFFAVAESGDDFSFVHSSWTKGIETWRYQVDSGEGEKNYAHTLMDRTLLKPGETLSMKHILRAPQAKGFALMSKKDLPTEMEIEHESGEQKFTQKLIWSASGSSLSTWKIPVGAKLGRWQITLINSKSKIRISSGELRVENFRIPVMKGQIQTPTEDLVAVKKVPLHIGVEYLAGGPANELNMKLRWKSEEALFHPDREEFQSYSFLNGGLKEGIFRQRNEDSDSEEESEVSVGGSFESKDLKLDKNGSAQIDIGNFKTKEKAQQIRVEAEYRDPSGETQTLSRQLTLWPADLVVGIKPTSWSATKDNVSFDILVLNTQKKPVAKAAVEVVLYEQNYISHRKKLVGGFYGYEDFREIKKIGRLCQGKTDERGSLKCAGKSPVAGSLIGVARVQDAKGRWSLANTNQYVVASDQELWFGSNDNDRADLIPNKKSFEPGETALFQLKTPFKNQKVLFTLEREGVLDYQVVDVNSTDPTLHLKIKPEWAPNVFVNAFAIRGRVGDPQPTALVDLGKPAFKMGLTEIKVGWKKHELKVQVETDKKIYHVREKAQAKIRVVNSGGQGVKGEVTVAVVDEGLLELRPNDSWKLLPVMMRSRSLGVTTATAQTQVVGKRHFGLKALAAGGDGRGSGSRELFDTLLLWKGTLPLDAKGQAQIEIPINDSLTSFRVVVIAVNGVDQFGTGSTAFQTTQDLMIFAGLPAQVREGDQIQAEYNLRNVTSRIQDLSLNLEAGGQKFAEQKIQLKPNESREILWPMKVPAGNSDLTYRMSAVDGGGKKLDEILKHQSVIPVWLTEVQQSTLQRVEGAAKIPVDKPAGSIAGSELTKLEVSRSLLGSREGIKNYWANYAYSCLEQQVSRAVSLHDLKNWQKIEAGIETYIDIHNLLKFFPSEREGSEALSAYVLSIAHEAGYKFSAVHEKRLLSGLQDFINSKDIRHERLPMADREIRKLYALETLSRYRVFKPEMLTSMNIAPEQWPTSALVVWYQILLWEKTIPKQAALLSQAENLIRSRMYYSGTKMSFSDEKDDQFWWMLSSGSVPLQRLMLVTAKLPNWKADVPKLARASLLRQKQGSWDLTTANAWGVLASDRYRAEFEKQKVAGSLSAKMGAQEKSWAWSQGEGGFDFKGPSQKESLSLRQNGAGIPYVAVHLLAAVPAKQPVSSGFKIERSVEAVQQKKSGLWSRGDVLRVKLKVTSMADNGWVVIQDPVPAGASILGSGLGKDSSLLDSAGGATSAVNSLNQLHSTFEERSYSAMKMYYYWFPKGSYEVEYRLRLNQAGEFQLPATRVEAMYNPDIFGLVPNAVMKVEL